MKNQQFSNFDEFDPELMESIQRIASAQAGSTSVLAVAEIAKKRIGSREQPAIERGVRTARPEGWRGRFGIRSSMARWGAFAAAAACLLVFLTIAFSPGESNLFANMQARLRQVFAISCTSAFYRPDEPLPWKTCEYSFQDFRWFREDRMAFEIGEATSVFDLDKAIYGSWYPARQEGVVGKIGDVDLVRKKYDLFLSILLNLDAKDAAIVDRYRRDGIRIVEYELPITYPNGATLMMNVMVDQANTLPVEIHFLGADGKLMRTLNHISFDQQFAPDLFLTDPPEGYNVKTQNFGE